MYQIICFTFVVLHLNVRPIATPVSNFQKKIIRVKESGGAVGGDNISTGYINLYRSGG